MVQLGLGEMGYSAAAFWDLTLPEFTLASRGYRSAQQREDFRIGTIAALFANLHRDEKKRPEPFVPADFFASLPRPRLAEEVDVPPTDAELDAFLTKLQFVTSHENGSPETDGRNA